VEVEKAITLGSRSWKKEGAETVRRVGLLVLLCVLVLAPGPAARKAAPAAQGSGLPVVKDLQAVVDGGKVRLA